MILTALILEIELRRCMLWPLALTGHCVTLTRTNGNKCTWM